MPAENLPGAGSQPATPASAPAPTQSAPAQAATPAPSVDLSGHVTGEDFKDPVWGRKIENLYKQNQDYAKKFKDVESDAEWGRKARQELELLTRNSPEFREALKKAYGVQDAAPQPGSDGNNGSLNPDELLNRMRSEVASELAIERARSAYPEFFKSDEDLVPINQVLDEMDRGGPAHRLELAIQLVRLRRGTAAAAAPAQAPSGTAASEGSRGSAAPVPEGEPKTPEERMAKAVREAGFGSWTELLQAEGALPR